MEASAEVFGLSSLYLLSRRWVRDPSGFRDPETRHTLGHAHDSVQMLKMLLKGKKKKQGQEVKSKTKQIDKVVSC